MLESAALPSDWRENLEITRKVGTELLNQADYLLIRMPCLLVPFAWNVLLNPRHPDAARCLIAEVVESAFDPRLIR
jgi:hypothetical protein